jgi:FlaA1/EpsC-like NDP-sugar epimerase
MLRLRHASLAYFHDIAMAAMSFPLALWLRVGDDTLGPYRELLWQGTLLVAVIAAVVFRTLGLYRGIWRYASLNDLFGLVRAVSLVVLILVPLLFLMTRAESLPRSVPIIEWGVLLVLLGGPRFVYRVWKDRRSGRFSLRPPKPEGIPVLLAGAGDGAELFIRTARQGPATLYRPVGMIAEGAGRVGRNIHGVDVLGTFNEMAQVAARLEKSGNRPQRLILTLDDLDGAVVRRLVDAADSLGMTVARLPKITELRSGLVDELEVRPVAVEDLLNRPQTVLDRDGMSRLFSEKRVLVTGAGGTIGSELVRQISAFGPAELALLDNGEFNLYSIDLELQERTPDLPRRTILADVRDRAGLGLIFAEVRPEIVVHAAALKHVPMVEGNPTEGILTNAIGTRCVAEACRAAGVSVMVQISTDKAVNPTNVMGASKRLAEAWCQALDLARRESGGTRFVTVRFGNVLGSTGSVVPLFQRQLAQGGPLTVTHAEVKRYFMTVREAVELVLQATVLSAEHDEPGKIYVLDMGEPVRIIDLARQMIRLAGLRPGEDIEIKITGLRPGEKLFEEIFHIGEPLLPTASKGILLAGPRIADGTTLGRALDELAAACRRGDRTASLQLLRRLVPEYRPYEEVPLPAAASL